MKKHQMYQVLYRVFFGSSIILTIPSTIVAIFYDYFSPWQQFLGGMSLGITIASLISSVFFWKKYVQYYNLHIWQIADNFNFAQSRYTFDNREDLIQATNAILAEAGFKQRVYDIGALRRSTLSEQELIFKEDAKLVKYFLRQIFKKVRQEQLLSSDIYHLLYKQ